MTGCDRMKMPLMMNMDGKALVLGGGKVGMHKVSQLSKFDVPIILIDREEIEAPGGVQFIKKDIRPDNLNDIITEDVVLVVSALENRVSFEGRIHKN